MSAAKPTVNVLVTDLDNTVWDWFEVWRTGFSAFLDELVAISGVNQATLETEIRVVHQANGTSEYSPTFLIPQLPSLQDGSTRDELLDRYQDATHAWHSGRKHATQLYPGVLETLLAARAAGVIVVGHTESQAFVTAQRILRTDLDGVIDYLYSPSDHEIPRGVSLDEVRQYDPSAYELKLTRHFYTPPGAKKPSIEVLRSILADIHGAPGSTVYVGDSRMKDIAMARDLGVHDVWARYGEVQDHAEYELLRRVSHWPDSDVNEEKRIAEENSITPTRVLETGFHELQEMFTFARRRPLTDGELQRSLTAWQQTIEVQEHFNDLEMRIRNFGLTLVVAVLGVTGAVLKDANWLLTAGLVFGAGIAWAGFYLMDRWWYHPLLIGAVVHGMDIEDALAPQVTGIGLTRRIREASHVKIFGKPRDSSTKMNWFYGAIGAVLVLVLSVVVITGVLGVWTSEPTDSSNSSPESPTASP